MLTQDLEEDENRTFFFYLNATESRKNITEKEPNLMKHFFLGTKVRMFLK